jgi:hypothetical protein
VGPRRTDEEGGTMVCAWGNLIVNWGVCVQGAHVKGGLFDLKRVQGGGGCY